MTRRLFGAVAAFAIVAGSAQPAQAQFALGYTDIGATIGLGGIGSAGLAFGARFERALRAAPEGLGTGVIGLQVGADYYGWSASFPGYSWDVSYIPISATANYHFDLENDRIDPFAGVGLGYQIVSCSYSGSFGTNTCGYSSGIYFVGRLGARYFMNPNLALYGDVGAGAATLNVGAMFKVSD
jgi:hypothetical protein